MQNIHGMREEVSLVSSSAHRTTPQTGPRAGVGLVFKESFEGIVVQSVLKEGGAATSARPPQAGDLLVSVDAQDVRRKTLTQLRLMLVGDEGSAVALSFEDSAGNVYTTSAQRRFPRFQFGARHQEAPSPPAKFALEANADTHDVQMKYPSFGAHCWPSDVVKSPGDSGGREAGSDVRSMSEQSVAHSAEVDADHMPSWTASWVSRMRENGGREQERERERDRRRGKGGRKKS